MSFSSVLPPAIDNQYRGQAIALWIFGLLVLMKIGMSVSSIFNGREVAQNADGVPLDSYSPAAAQTIVALFAIFGLAHLVLCALCLLVLVRYRSLIPFMFGVLLVEQLSRKAILQFLPIIRTGTPPASAINLAVLVLMVAGLGLSLWKRSNV
jgi:hypothetical protein